MHKDVVRRSILLLLLIIGFGAGFMAWSLHQRIDRLLAADEDLAVQLDRTAATAIDIGVAQQAYVMPGQLPEPWLEHMSALLRQLGDEMTALKAFCRSADAPAYLEALTDGTSALVRIDMRARDYLLARQPLTAADLILNEGRKTVNGIIAELTDLRHAERQAFAAERAALSGQLWMVLGVAGLVWTAGMVVFALEGRLKPAPTNVETISPVGSDFLPDEARSGERAKSGSRTESALTASEPVVIEPSATPLPAIDLAAAADICTRISRVTTAAGLSPLLAGAARVLDASGIILWMSAGDELFAATAHGYDPRMLNRLGPIGRAADNATAAAWRTGELQTVAGDLASSGAIVAPMFGGDRCIGVLAAEVRPGRESDPATRAVTAMIGAQLAAVVAAWPAGSAPAQTTNVATA